MAEPAVPKMKPVVAPGLGVRYVPEGELGEAEAGGAREAAPAEVTAAKGERAARAELLTPSGLAKEYGETWLAGNLAGLRGTGEAVGLPVESGVSALFGKEGTDYIKHLEEAHPYVTGISRITGQVRGALGAAELTGSPGSVGAGVVPRTLGGVATRAAVGGVENVVAATTSDINEGALGRADVNGEKLLAAIPKHFAVGAALTGVFEGGAAAVEAGAGAAKRTLSPLLERGASKAIGKELGESGEAAVRAGERVRTLAGEVPRSRASLIDTLEAEQGRLRGGEQETYEKTLDTLRGQHQTEAGTLAARQEGERVAAAASAQRGIGTAEREAAEGQLEAAARGGEGVEAAELGGARARQAAHGEAFEANAAAADAEGRAGGAELQRQMAEAGQMVNHVEQHYGGLRETLAGEREAAAGLAARLGKERDAASKELGETLLRIREGGHSPSGALTPKQFDEILEEYLGMTGHKGDPSARWAAESHLREVYKDEMSAAATSSEAASSHVERLKSMAGDLERAHTEAVEHLKRVDDAGQKLEVEYQRDMATAGKLADQKVAAFQKSTSKEAREANAVADAAMAKAKQVEEDVAAQVEAARGKGAKEVAKAEAAGQKRIAMAEAEAAAAKKQHEGVLAKEKKSLASEQAKAEKGVAKPTGKTDVDPMLENVRARGKAANDQPMVSGSAGLGAVFSVMHGNPVTAAGALLGSFAAGRMRAEGNFIAARVMKGLSDRIGRVDEAIRAGAAMVVGKAASKGALAIERELSGPKRTQPKFEDVARRIREAQANPSLVESHVKNALGVDATAAPSTYASTLMAAKRAQMFLESVLPKPQIDTHSLTPHLEHLGISDTEKDEFMRTLQVVDDPLALFAATKDGTVTEDQVSAVKAIYGSLYPQMRREVMSHVASLTKPIDYERELALGVMLGSPTNEVEDRDFQGTLSAAYQDKSAAQAPQGSKSRSGASKLTKDVQSASEKVERGDV